MFFLLGSTNGTCNISDVPVHFKFSEELQLNLFHWTHTMIKLKQYFIFFCWKTEFGARKSGWVSQDLNFNTTLSMVRIDKSLIAYKENFRLCSYSLVHQSCWKWFSKIRIHSSFSFWTSGRRLKNAQLVFICSKSTTETLEQCLKSLNRWRRADFFIAKLEQREQLLLCFSFTMEHLLTQTWKLAFLNI